MDPQGFRADLMDEYPCIVEGYSDYAILVAEITGDEEAVWRLKSALRSREVYYLHYDPESELGANTDTADHLLLTYEAEMYPEREVIHDRLFETLMRAKEDIGNALER